MALSLISYLIWAVALIGTLSSTVYLGLILVAVLKFRADSRKLHSLPVADAKLSPVSMIKPVHGLEPQLRENIESFFRQDYPQFEILFGADTADDAALPVVREISARYPQVPCRCDTR